MLGFGAPDRRRPVRRDDGLPGTGPAAQPQAVANYIAKYATKTLDAPGVPDRPLRHAARHRRAALLGPLPSG